MPSHGKRWKKLKSIFKPNGGCGCGPNTAEVIEPKYIAKSSSDQLRHHSLSSSASSWRRPIVEDYTTTTFSHNIDDTSAETYDDRLECRKIQDSVAVIKDSEDPLSDFRKSMLQMIFEREMYSRSDLQQLLDCFLRLNSPHHREIIVRAFMEIWNNGGGGAGWTPPREVN